MSQAAVADNLKPPSNHYVGIQILRGIASLMVVLHHAGQQAELTFLSHLDWLHRGAFGVDLFFPISGFVILISTNSLLRKRDVHAAKEFAERRAIRVVPLYWLFTAAKVALVLGAPSVLRNSHFKIWNVVSSMLFLFSYNGQGSLTTVLPVGWTLNYEMFFYAVILLALVLRKPLLVWCSAIIGGIALLGVFLPHHYALSFFAHPIELEFLAGMFLARYAYAIRRSKPLAGVCLVALGCLGIASYDPGLSITMSLLRPLIWGVPGALIVAGFVALEDSIHFQRFGRLLLLGDASYALYLTHGFVLPVIGKICAVAHLHRAAVPVFFLLSVGCSVTFGLLIHLKIELPLLERLLHARTSWSVRSAPSTGN